MILETPIFEWDFLRKLLYCQSFFFFFFKSNDVDIGVLGTDFS